MGGMKGIPEGAGTEGAAVAFMTGATFAAFTAFAASGLDSVQESPTHRRKKVPMPPARTRRVLRFVFKTRRVGRIFYRVMG